MIRIVRRCMLHRYEPRSLGEWLRGVLGAPKNQEQEENEAEEQIDEEENSDSSNSDDDDRHGGIKMPIPEFPSKLFSDRFNSNFKTLIN